MTTNTELLTSHKHKFNDIILLMARSIDALPVTKQSEVDIIEMLDVTKTIITQRLVSGIYTERQKDKKRKYTALYISIRAELTDCIRSVLVGLNNRATGFVLQKYTTLALDALFDVLIECGPERAIAETIELCDAAKSNILELQEPDPFDSSIAHGALQSKSRERALRHRKPLTKAQRLAAIAIGVEKYRESNAA